MEDSIQIKLGELSLKNMFNFAKILNPPKKSKLTINPAFVIGMLKTGWFTHVP
jgi:hypothetical protein